MNRLEFLISETRNLINRRLFTSAEPLCEEALALAPDNIDVLLHSGMNYFSLLKPEKAAKVLEHALEIDPESTEAKIYLLATYRQQNHVRKVKEMADLLYKSAKDSNELALAYTSFLYLCDWEAAEKIESNVINETIAGKVDYELLPAILLNSNGRPNISVGKSFKLHQQWAKRHPRTLDIKLRQINGRIRIAYVSGDFNRHPVAYFMHQIILAHNRTEFEVFCYANLGDRRDDLTEEFIQNSDHFIDTSDIDDMELKAHMRQHNIHIAVDLSGHTLHSRVSAFSLRLAPVQISYLGYPNTSGLTAMDFHISDSFAEDKKSGTRYSEKLLLMPKSFLCYGVDWDLEKSAASPCEKNGFITFGSFNDGRKINSEVIEAWCQILAKVPGSQLNLKFVRCDDELIRENLLKEFAKHGIDADRIHSLPRTSLEEHMRGYGDIDIFLDSFPYTGTTTTCEALSQGVPVVTLVGPKHANRVSYSILKNIGYEETIAHSIDEYVSKAVNLALNPQGLTIVRSCLVMLFQHSPLKQTETFIHDFEGVLKQACRKKGIKLNLGSEKTEKPVIRLIHNMARSGSTLICKCLGSMKGINLLSEIHPLAVAKFNPLNQGHEWFGLLTQKDIAHLRTNQIPFNDSIALLNKRSLAQGSALVVRDWAHLDFTGHPFLKMPSYKLGLEEQLSNDFELLQISTTRHPVDQWLSLSRLEIMKESIDNGELTIASFLHGYLEFARYCVKTGFIRYEDFTHHPEEVMQTLCQHLQLPYDPTFIDRWSSYNTITGDTISTRGGNEIKALKRRDIDAETLAAFECEDSYHEALELLGYSN